MNRFPAPLALAIALLGIVPAGCTQHAGPATAGALPDACKLMLPSDVGKVFPGSLVDSGRPMLSPAFVSTRPYNAACVYRVRKSKNDFGLSVELDLRSCDACSDKLPFNPGAIATFASIRSSRYDLATKPGLQARLQPLQGVGDQALEKVDNYDVTVDVRTDDLVFSIDANKDLPGAGAAAVGLARQVAKRWHRGVGMVEAATPAAAGSAAGVTPGRKPAS